MQVQHNSQACSRRSCSRKEISITFSECVFVALVNRHIKRMRHFVVEIRPMGCMQTEGRTDMTQRIVASRSFASAPKN